MTIHSHTIIVQCPLTNPGHEVIEQGAAIIKRGGLVVYPTDTFYGLGGDPRNRNTVIKIFEAKRRPAHKPLPIIVSSRSEIVQLVAHIPHNAERLMDIFWPGPLTILFPAAPFLPFDLTAGTGKIGIRWPKSPIATTLSHKAGSALIATSANLSGNEAVLNPHEIRSDLDGFVDLIIDAGVLPPSRGSTIVDSTCYPVRIIREGEISHEMLTDGLQG